MKYEEIYIKYLNQETDLILFNLKVVLNLMTD